MDRQPTVSANYYTLATLAIGLLIFFTLSLTVINYKVQAQEEFIVKIGHNKIFTECNFTEYTVKYPPPPAAIITPTFGAQEFSLSYIVLPGVSPGVNPQIKQGVQFTVVSGDNDKQSGLAEISINLEYRLSAYTASLEHGATSVVYNGVADNNDYFDVVISSNDDGSQPSGLVEKTGTVTYKTLSINLSVGSNHTFFAFISGDAFNLPFNQQNASFQGWVKIKEIRINFITAAIPAILQLLLIE